MPLYTSITRGSLPDDTKARIAEELTRIHCEVMKVPAHFVHVIFLFRIRKGSDIPEAKNAGTSLNCVLRSGHTVEEKTDLLKQLWLMFQAYRTPTISWQSFCKKFPQITRWKWDRSCKR